jgi:hypothetical protein
MDECAVETCRRSAVICVDLNDPPKWAVCRTCWMSMLGFGPYVVRAVWNRDHTLQRFVALQPETTDDDRGPVL